MGKVGMNLGIGLGIKKGSAQIWTPNMVPGLLVEFNARKPVTVYTDNYNKVLEVFDTEGGFTVTENHGILASLLNGTDQYWQLPLPLDLAVFTPSTISPATNGAAPTGWDKFGSPILDYVTTEAGSSGCMKVVTSSANWGIIKTSVLTVGKKYKFQLRYKSTVNLKIGDNSSTNRYGTYSATSEWNTISLVKTITNTTDITILPEAAGTFHIESLTIKEDQGLDLNRDQEQILHSKNWDFERTLGTDILTNTGWASTTDWTGSIDGLAAGISGREDMALEFDGSAEYLQIALPSDIAVFTPSTISGNNAPTGWGKNGGTITYETTESGSSGCMKYVVNTSIGVYKTSFLTVGKKYKLAIRYKSTANLLIGVSLGAGSYFTLDATSEWNTITKIFTSSSTLISISSLSGTFYIESLTIKEEQGFDLNKDQEQILHSKNWDFERTLGTELNSGTVTIGSKYVVTAGTVEGNAIGTEFLATTTATTLDANNKVKPIPNLVSNGTFDSATGWTVGTNATIADGVVHFIDGAYEVANVRVANKLIVGKRYRVVYEIKNYVKGGTRVRSGISYGTLRAANGVYNEDMTADATTFYIYSRPTNVSDLTTLDIDNVHLYEIPEWTATGNHTQNLSIIDDSGTGTHSMLITASGAGDSGSNHVKLPSANIESVVSGKKYTLEGFARLDASSLTYGANILTNGDFETGVNTDNLAAETNCTLTFNDTETGKTGSYCLKQTNTVAGYGWYKTLPLNKIYKISLRYKSPSATIIVRSNAAVTTILPISADWSSVTFYTYLTSDYLRFWLNGVTSAFFDDIVIQQADMVTLTAQLGTKSVTSSELSIVAGTFTKFVLNFEATASEQSQDLKLYLSGAGSVFVDKLSLTQAYDMWVSTKVYPTEDEWTTIIDTYNATGWLLNKRGETNQWGFLVSANDAGGDVSSPVSTLNNNVWRTIGMLMDKTLYLSAYENGVNIANQFMTPKGKVFVGKAMTIGGVSLCFDGQISHLQIIRFENISQSTFNSAITGLQYPTGGGAEEVLRLTFQDGTSFANTLKDYSPKNHSISNPGSTMDLTNRKRVQ